MLVALLDAITRPNGGISRFNILYRLYAHLTT